MATLSMKEEELLERVEELPPLKRWWRAFLGLLRLGRNPNDIQAILEFTVYANAGGAGKRLKRFFADPSGRRLFEER